LDRRGQHRSRRGARVEQRLTAGAGAAAIVVYLAASGGAFGPIDIGRGSFAIWVAIALLVLGGLLPAVRPAVNIRLPLAAFLLFVGWVAVSLLWTESAERAVADLTRLALLGGVLVLVAFGLARDAWRSAAAGMAIAVIGVAAIAATSRLFPELFGAAAEPSPLAPTRLAYPVEYWNGLAGLSAMAVCAGIGWGVHHGSRRVRALALASVPLSALALYLTYSRGGLLALAAGLACLLFLSRDRRALALGAGVALSASVLVAAVARSQESIASAEGGEGGPVVALTVLGAGALCGWYATRGSRDAGLAAAAPMPLALRVGLAAGLAAVAVAVGTGLSDGGARESRGGGLIPNPAARLGSLETNRSSLWESAIEAFAEHPAGGLGSGSYELWLARDPEAEDLAADAHSLPLETAAELGLPGVIILAVFVWALTRGALRSHRRLKRDSDQGVATVMLAFLVVFLVQSLFDWAWEVAALSVLGLGAGAITIAAGQERRHHGARARPRAAAFVASLAIAFGVVPGLVAAERVDLSERALAAEFTSVATDAAEDAVSAAPWGASGHAQLAEVALASGELETARLAARDAIEREPVNWRHQVLAARIAATAGDESTARTLLLRVARLRPAGAEVARALARDPQSLAAAEPETHP
jgi:hypothetical protein